MEQQLVPEDTTESRTNEEAVATTRTETNPKSGAESELETRIAKHRNKTILHVTQEKSTQPSGIKELGAREDPTRKTIESTSATHTVHVKTTGRNKAFPRKQEQRAPAKWSRMG